MQCPQFPLSLAWRSKSDDGRTPVEVLIVPLCVIWGGSKARCRRFNLQLVSVLVSYRNALDHFSFLFQKQKHFFISANKHARKPKKPSFFSLQCFNLDICDIDAKDPWTEYRRKINIFKVLLSVKKQFKQSFICYFKEERRGYKLFPVVLLKLNTTFAEFFFWFVFPVTVLCLCWISIVFVCYWFCYPCDKEEPSMRTEYHEINTVDSDRNDYSANASGMGSGLPSAGHDGGGWPTRGPADGDTGNWPLYWR